VGIPVYSENGGNFWKSEVHPAGKKAAGEIMIFDV
jgi:hypothetical protein